MHYQSVEIGDSSGLLCSNHESVAVVCHQTLKHNVSNLTQDVTSQMAEAQDILTDALNIGGDMDNITSVCANSLHIYCTLLLPYSSYRTILYYTIIIYKSIIELIKPVNLSKTNIQSYPLHVLWILMDYGLCILLSFIP